MNERHDDVIDTHEHAYARLTPDCILNALDAVGFAPEAALMPMNSYENRVYAFRDHEQHKHVVKFYRPERWTHAQIQEEHQFLFELVEADIPVIAPEQRDGTSVFEFESFLFAVFPQCGGRPFESGNPEQLAVMGRTVGRLHACAQVHPFIERPVLSIDDYVRPALKAMSECPHFPKHLREPYQHIATELADRCHTLLKKLPDAAWQRTHGDMHPGNLMWSGDGVLIVDFDDCRRAPAVQDLWMLADTIEQRAILIDEYEQFCEFDWSQWRYAEVLRSMRLMQYAGWLAARWLDPTFPRHFPWFASEQYFAQHIEQLRDQVQLLEAQ